MYVIREAVTVHVAQDSTHAAVIAAGDRSRDVLRGFLDGGYNCESLGV